MSPLHEQFLNNVDASPDSVLLHHLGRDWTYADIATRASALAARLVDGGMKPAARVVLLMANSAEYVCSYFAVLLAGGTVVALNPDTMSRELEHTVKHCGAEVIVCNRKAYRQVAAVDLAATDVRLALVTGQHDAELPENSHLGVELLDLENATNEHTAAPPRRPHELAQIIYTSGTTGRPKGVVLSHENLIANTASIVEYLRLSDRDSVFAILPFFYSYGNSLLTTHAAVGGRLVLASDFVFWNRAIALMKEQRATGFAGVPSTFAMLLHRSNFASMEFPDLRYLTCAGGALAPATVKRLQQHLGDIELFLMYGQTEATARLSTLMPKEVNTKLGSIGKGMPGVRLQVLDESGSPVAPGEHGEIYAQGDNIMVGYWEDAEATGKVKTGQGLRTGDLATVDEDGYIYIVGRRSDMIKSGAYRVNPLEIEETILEMPAVQEVAVTGEADEFLGEKIVAYVVAAAGGISEQEVMEYCGSNLPPHKSVRGVYLVAELPKTSSGKVRRNALNPDQRP